MKTISTSIHDDPPSIIPPFKLLLYEYINDDFLRDAIEYIARHYNSQYPGDIVVSILIVYFYINNVLYVY